MPRKLRVAVLMGGPSSEYEISIATGRKILTSLDSAKYLIRPVIVTKERKWLIPQREAFLLDIEQGNTDEPFSTALVPHEEAQALQEMGSGGTDVVFIAMHGEFGEDGTVQGLFESLGVAYTGSGVLASALGIDKSRSLAIFRDAGLRVPDFFVVTRLQWETDEDELATHAERTFGLPVVIKPTNRGSSVGVTVAASRGDVDRGVAAAFTYSDAIMIQRYIPGTEVSAGVLEQGRGAVSLPPTEIVPRESAFFDYHAKYTLGASDEITPPRLSPAVIRRIQETALRTHRVIGCTGMSRTDMIVGDDDELYVLEINTIPGLSEASILPKQTAAAGISYPELLDRIIAAAFRRNS